MNILFISFDADPPYMGGTATVANILARSFRGLGHFCALGYMDDSLHPSKFFDKKIKLVDSNRNDVEQFLIQNKFDVILNQLPTSVDYKFLKSLPLGDCKIISAYHNRPMLRPLLVENLMTLYSESESIVYKIYTLAKIPFLPVINFRSNKRLLKKFDDVSRYSDKILLLSKKFYPVWKKLAPKTDDAKLVAIGNPLVFKKSFEVDKLSQKKNILIAVCSINSQKRAHLMLKVWKYIEEDASFDEWKFVFVGGGEGFEQFTRLAAKMGLTRIDFVGYQNPYSFYKEASISIMTSKFEGWPMVLMEGQQMGVVPIAYNSFESITDIITDGENGIIVPNNDLMNFVKQVKRLMKNVKERENMASNAIISSDRFSINKIVDSYISLFNDVLVSR